MKVLIVLSIVILGVGFALGIEALIALLVTWVLNSFTQLHPTFWTTYILMILTSLLFGGGTAASRK